MDDLTNMARFADRLVRQDPGLSGTQYEEYRMQLEVALKTAERRERVTFWIVVGALIIGVAGMFIGGTRLFGSFDPTDENATILSVFMGVVYTLALITFWISLATYYSRFRPKVRDLKDQIRDTNLQILQNEIMELKEQIGAISRRGTSEK